MTEAQWALFTVLDGYSRFDLYEITAGILVTLLGLTDWS
jgi:hypothetical protein